MFNIKDKGMKDSIKVRLIKLAQNPYVQGVGSIADIFGPSTVKRSETLADDVQALRDDWMKVGNDMRVALDLYRKEVSYGK